MPELPEVETVRRSLEPGLLGGEIRAVTTSGKRLRQRAVDRAALEKLVGARFVATRRHGKYLLLDCARGDSATTLLVHLGMSGQLLLVEAGAAERAHTHVRITLSSGRELRYVDPRRFGIVRVYPTARVAEGEELAELGPDPIAGPFDVEALFASLRATRRDLKSALLDQRLVAGLGNIYVAEALFLASLSPRRQASRVSLPQARALHEAIAEVLRTGLANRGTSLSDYVDAAGEQGSNQHALFVYGRDGQPCRRCGAIVRKIVQGGRASFYCPRCQGRR